MKKVKKLGTFGGVFIPSILSILGVIMYMRLPWIVGNAGLYSTLGIVIVAHIISLTTGLSISSVATDKKVQTGGMYYIISRSMGLPIGGTLGLALFVGLSFSISLYLIGFAEAFLRFLNLDASLNSIRLTGFIALSIVTIITFISTKLAIKTQYFIFGAIILSLFSIFLGFGQHVPSEPGLLNTTDAIPWIVLFGIFFPAVTGFGAGVSMSGDLADPNRSIPQGTMAAILVGLAVYVLLTFYFAYFVDPAQLVNNPNVLFDISRNKYLVVAGIWGATLSSAMGSILAAPRILQAISKDKITPAFFAKGTGQLNEPRNALMLAFVIALGGILIGELNAIARIVSIFFIITYGFINLSCFIERWASSDFRPTFRIHPLISVTGALACFIVMIQLDLLAMVAATIILSLIFLYLKRRDMALSSGDAWISVWESIVKSGLLLLNRQKAESRNWRPNIILFSGSRNKRPHLNDLALEFAGSLGMVTDFEIIQVKENDVNFNKVVKRNGYDDQETGQNYFRKTFYASNVYKGIESIAQIYGFGGIEPNTVMLGFPNKKEKISGFLKLKTFIKKIDFNSIILKFNDQKGFGEQKNIHVWWEGDSRNLIYAISLLRFLGSGFKWKRAKMKLFFINNYNIPKETIIDTLNNVAANYRIDIDIDVINNVIINKDTYEIIKSESSQADLILYDAPEFFESASEDDVVGFSKKLDGLPALALVNACGYFENIELFPRKKEKTYADKSKLSSKLKETNHIPVPETRHNVFDNYLKQDIEKIEALIERFYSEFFLKLSENNEFINNNLRERINKFFDNTLAKIDHYKDLKNRRSFYVVWVQFMNELKELTQELIDNKLITYREFAKQAVAKFEDEITEIENILPARIKLEFTRTDFDIHKNDRLAVKINKFFDKLMFLSGRKSISRSIPYKKAFSHFVIARIFDDINVLLLSHLENSIKSFVDYRKILEQIKNSYYRIEIDIISDQINIADYLKFKEQINDDLNQFSDATELGILLYKRKIFRQLNLHVRDFSGQSIKPGELHSIKNQNRVRKNRQLFLENFSSYPTIWTNSIIVFLHKVLVDIMLQNLAINTKKRIFKIYNELFKQFLSSKDKKFEFIKTKIDDYIKETKSKGSFNYDLESVVFSELQIAEIFDDIFNQIKVYSAEIPEYISVPAVDESLSFDIQSYSNILTINLPLRRKINYVLASTFAEKIGYLISDFRNSINEKIKSINNLLILSRYNIDNEYISDSVDSEGEFLNIESSLSSLKERIAEEQDSFYNIVDKFTIDLSLVLKETFESISYNSLYSLEAGKKSAERSRKWSKVAFKPFKTVKNRVQMLVGSIFYQSSKNIIHIEKSRRSPAYSPVYEIMKFVDDNSPNPLIMEKLPVYYKNLFNNKFTADRRFWIPTETEMKKAEHAFSLFNAGNKGALMIIGERNSGKTSLSNYIAQEYFPVKNIFYIYPLGQGSCNVSDFVEAMSKATDTTGTIYEICHKMPDKSVVIINDIALWWERSKNGFAVIDLITELINIFGNKIMFILNSNIYAYAFIDRIKSINSYFIDIIRCEAFDTLKIRNLIINRHQAGHLKFRYRNMPESLILEWRIAQLFNHHFNYSKGVIGTALNSWLTCITDVRDDEIIITKPQKPDLEVFNNLDMNTLSVLVQLIYHRRLNKERLFRIMGGDKEIIKKSLMLLLNCKLIFEISNGIYLLNTFSEPHLINYLLKKEIILL